MWFVYRNGRKVFAHEDAEACIGHVADRTGLAREVVAESTRKGDLLIADAGKHSRSREDVYEITDRDVAGSGR